MSTTPTPGVPPKLATIKVISHSMLFYWWPVWLVGFVVGLLTWIENTRLVIVPADTKVTASNQGKDPPKHTYTLTFSEPPTPFLQEAIAAKDQPAFPIRISSSKDHGIVFVLILLMVIFITNVPMRGLWSVVVLMLMVTAILLLALFRLWGPILEVLGRLQIYISAEGYLVTSTVLFVLWVVVVLLYDQRRYISFTAGQIIVHREVGDMQQVYDTTNVEVQKRRSDLFRHWMLGFGSGDLVIQLPGTGGTQIVLPNVLFAARRVQEVSNLMKTRPVINE